MFDRRLILVLISGWPLIAESAHAETTLRSWTGVAAGDALGAGFATVHDFDGDGIHDFAIGAPGDDTQGTNRGVVRLVSGADGHEIRRYYGGVTEPGFGASVTRLGDFDFDGVVDLIVGSNPQLPDINVPRKFSAVSGAGGNLTWSFSFHASTDGRGTAVVALGDVNFDGRADVGIGVSNEFSQYNGRLRVFSGLDGSVLHDLLGSGTDIGSMYGLAPAGDLDGDSRADFWMTYASLFQSSHAQARSGIDGHVLADITVPLVFAEYTGVRLLGGNDLNGDGVLDLVVGSPASPGKGGNGPGHVYAYSGASPHALLWSQVGANQTERIGLFVYDVGDLDGDGVHDVGTSVGFQIAFATKTARFYSGATGAPIGAYATTSPNTILLNVDAAGDVDGDGHGDWAGAVLAANSFGQITTAAVGTAQVRTFAHEALAGDRFALAHSLGGVQTLVLDFGPAFAGRKFQMLGSLTGTTGGFATVAGPIPLTPDPYFGSTRRAGGNGHLAPSNGLLDAQGRASATFTLTPGSTRFPIGTILRHAAIAFDATGTWPEAISRAVPLVVSVDG